MNICLGITKKYERCKIMLKYKKYCKKHENQKLLFELDTIKILSKGLVSKKINMLNKKSIFIDTDLIDICSVIYEIKNNCILSYFNIFKIINVYTILEIVKLFKIKIYKPYDIFFNNKKIINEPMYIFSNYNFNNSVEILTLFGCDSYFLIDDNFNIYYDNGDNKIKVEIDYKNRIININNNIIIKKKYKNKLLCISPFLIGKALNYDNENIKYFYKRNFNITSKKYENIKQKCKEKQLDEILSNVLLEEINIDNILGGINISTGLT